MADFDPRNPLKRPSTPPSTAWFEFLLDDSLLEKHLGQNDPEPSATDLISLFLYQAELASATAKEIIDKESLPNGDIKELQNGELPKQENTETKKVKALRLLAMKAASYLNWNLDILEKVPVAIVQAILFELLKVTLGSDPPDPRQFAHMDLGNLSPEVLFSVLLYHRWCVRAAVKESFPVRPSKVPNVQVPGLVDPTITSASMKDSIMNTIMHGLDDSVSVLEHFVENMKDALMPSIKSIGSIKDLTDNVSHDWSQGVQISYREMACQVHSDLGCLYFYRQQYGKADKSFRQTHQILSQLHKPVFCSIDNDRLKGYCCACCSILGAAPIFKAEPTLAERVELARKNKPEELLTLLKEDNEKKELSLEYRAAIEEETIRTSSDSRFIRRMLVTNLVRKCLDSRLVCPGLTQQLNADTSLFEYLIVMSGDLAHSKTLSFPQKANLKHFIKYICYMSEQKTASKVVSSKSKVLQHLFTSSELQALKTTLKHKESAEELNVQNSLPSPLEESQMTGELERDLLVCYDPNTIKQLVQTLSNRITSSQLVYLSQKCSTCSPCLPSDKHILIYLPNEQWLLPRDVSQLIENLPIPQKTLPLYIHVVVAKSRVCTQLQVYDKARELLYKADFIVKDVSYKLSKYLRWEILKCEIMWYHHHRTMPPDTSQSDLLKRTKSCVSATSQHEMIPNLEVVQNCSAFLLNGKDWDYLASLSNFRNSFMEMSSLIGTLAKELQESSPTARKAARELWEAVALVYTNSVQQKRSGAGNATTVHREGNLGMFPVTTFIAFICRLQDPLVIAAILSLLCKLYNILKDDITVEIYSDYATLWPTTLGNVSAMNTPAIAESVSVFMEHAMTIDSSNVSSLRTQGDLFFAHGQYSEALKNYLELGASKTNFFTSPITKDTYDEAAFKRMIKCCSYLQCHTQVAILCLFLDEIDYATAFKALQERTVHDALDVYYDCIWDVTMLEYLIHMHAKRGEHEVKQYCIKLIGQLELNSSNHDKILMEAAKVRKGRFLRALSNQYF